MGMMRDTWTDAWTTYEVRTWKKVNAQDTFWQRHENVQFCSKCGWLVYGV